MRFIGLFLIFVIFGFAVFGVLGMMEAMEYGHGFCFAVSRGPLCPEIVSAFISHLTVFQKMFVSVLREVFVLAFAVIWCIARVLLLRHANLRFVFSFCTRIKQNFLSQFAVAKQKFLFWLSFHEQSPSILFGA